LKTLALLALIFLQLSSFGVESVGFNPDAVLTDIYPLIQKLYHITGYRPTDVIPAVFGEVKFVFVETDLDGYTCTGWLWCYGIVDPLNVEESTGILIHELGHKFLADLNLPYSEINLNLGYTNESGRYIHVTGIHPYTGRYQRTALGYPRPWQPYEQHRNDNTYYNSYQEDFADMFMNWALGRFSEDEAGRLRRVWIDAFVRAHTPRNRLRLDRRLEFVR